MASLAAETAPSATGKKAKKACAQVRYISVPEKNQGAEEKPFRRMKERDEVPILADENISEVETSRKQEENAHKNVSANCQAGMESLGEGGRFGQMWSAIDDVKGRNSTRR